MSHAANLTGPQRPSLLVLVGMMVASQMAITIHLAALPALPGLLDTTPVMVQYTISLYLAAFALSQLVVGPLSDALGRRRVAIAGVGFFTIASIAASLAPSIEYLIVARVFQATGACAGIAISRAIVRDCYSGPASVRAMTYLSIAMAIMPAIAPLIGGSLLVHFGWRSMFAVTAGTGFLAMIAVIATLPETLPKSARRPLIVAELARSYSVLIAKRTFMTYGGGLALINGSFNGYLVATPIVLITLMGVPADLFGLYTLPMPLGFMAGSLVSNWLVNRHGIDTLIRSGFWINIISGLMLGVLTVAGLDTPLTIIPPLILFSIGNGFIVPNCLAGALDTVSPSFAGAASAFTGFMQMSVSGIVTAIFGLIVFASPMPLVVLLTGASLAGWALFLFKERVRPKPVRMAGD